MGYGSTGGGSDPSKETTTTVLEYSGSVVGGCAANTSIGILSDNQYVHASGSALSSSLDISEGTISLWFRMQDSAVGQGGSAYQFTIFGRGGPSYVDSTHKNYWAFIYDPYQQQIHFTFFAEGIYVRGWRMRRLYGGYGVHAEYANWNHMLVTLPGTSGALYGYWNGVVAWGQTIYGPTEFFPSSSMAGGDFYMGVRAQHYVFNGNTFDVTSAKSNTHPIEIKDVAMWNNVLDANSIDSLHSGTLCPAEISSSNLVLYYDMDEGTGTTLEDRGGNNNANLINMENGSGYTSSVPPNLENTIVYSTTSVPNPSSAVEGSNHKYILKQKGKGSIVFGDKFKFPGGTPPIVTPDIGSVDVLECISDGTNLYCNHLTKDAK
jgi:hypothetical protein